MNKHVTSWFQAATVPNSWDVCGVICKRLTVWHVYALGEQGNGYFTGTQIDMDAAAEVLLFASGGHQHGKRLFACPNYRNRARRKIYAKLKRMKWDEVHAEIMDFIGSCMRTPGHIIREHKSGDGRSKASAPIAWCIVDFLSHGNPDKIELAWDTPYQTAMCLFDAHRDVNGLDDTLESRDQEERYDKIEAERKAALNGDC